MLVPSQSIPWVGIGSIEGPWHKGQKEEMCSGPVWIDACRAVSHRSVSVAGRCSRITLQCGVNTDRTVRLPIKLSGLYDWHEEKTLWYFIRYFLIMNIIVFIIALNAQWYFFSILILTLVGSEQSWASLNHFPFKHVNIKTLRFVLFDYALCYLIR